MERGELLVRGSVWLALLLYPAGPAGVAFAGKRAWRVARALWTAGCAVFLLHVASAFQVFHHWSHAAALEETARQTAELTGSRSGAGLYLNYLFTLLWLAEVIRWWARPEGYMRRPLPVLVAVHGFFLFMIFNGAVIFEGGATRVMGLLVTAAGGLALARSLRPRRDEPRPAASGAPGAPK